jgi:hypothetical protein
MTIPLEVVENSLGRIFETMYFAELESAGSGVIACCDRGVGASISFSGAATGELRIAATSRLAAQLAADFVAVDTAELTAGEEGAIMQELANVACGCLLAEWMPGSRFEFGIPTALEPSEIERIWPLRFAIGSAPPELAAELRITG